MTRNAGSREMSQATIGFGGAERDRAAAKTAQSAAKSALERVFSPEFRNRLDAIVTFQRCSPDVMETIVEKFILQLEAQLRERRVAFALDARGARVAGAEGVRPVFGARPLARVIQTEVRDPLTDEILFGALEHGGTVKIGLDGDALTFTCEPAARPRHHRRRSRRRARRPSQRERWSHGRRSTTRHQCD